MDWNPFLLTDSYKLSHYRQYPPKTETVYSYFESRGGDFKEVVFFGLQYYLLEYLRKFTLDNQGIGHKLDEARAMSALHFNNEYSFNYEGWRYILEKHFGRLPVVIRAVPEGTVVPTHNVLMTIENTDPKCFWLTNWLETILVQVWYGCTVATQSREMKKVIKQYLEETGDPSLIDFKLHDFGFRGVSSVETAGVGGAAHLINFRGTDTLAGVMLAKDFYYESMAGYSIPASEHSTITSWGPEHEVDAMRNMLDQYPSGMVACVSDSFDIFKACHEYWGGALKEQVLSRNGTLVVRPDSGDPPFIVCEVLRTLGYAFGTETNEKGFRVLNPKVRVIQGDGIDFKMLGLILEKMKNHGWSADNVAFGSGGGLLQKLNRDTLKFAFKCSSITVDGVERNVFKNPITDPGKVSKTGRMKLIKAVDGDEISWKTVSSKSPGDDQLVEVFRDGMIMKKYSFTDIRKNAALL